MTSTPSQYVPISCEFHDTLEDLATLRQRTVISYHGDDGAAQERTAVIKDVYARDGAEYIALDSGELVRLDRLIEVNGVKLADFSAHCAIK